MRTQRALFTSLTLTTLLFIAVPAIAATVATKPKQTPAAAFIMWQTDTVVPSGYMGKALLNRTAPITATVLAIKDNFAVDLKNTQIRWYINNVFVAGGVGVASVVISAEDSPEARIVIRASLEDFGPDTLTATVAINRNAPTVALAPPATTALRSGALTLQAVPYFFTDTAGTPLQYRWNVNGQIRSIVDDILVLDTSSADRGQSVSVTVEVTNPQNPIESATTELVLRIP